MHGAPGHQNAAHHSGANNDCHLFDDTPKGEEYREQTVELWQAIASHFNGCETVAGFDLLNEPYCDMELNSKAYSNINSMYDRLYSAVRKVNPDTTLIMEGIWRLNDLPSPASMVRENVMYEVHLYDYTESKINENSQHLDSYSKKYDVPVYVG